MKFLKIKETCLYLDDLERAKDFYNGVLGLSIINYEPEKHIFFRAGASVLLCFNPQDSKRKKSPPGHFGGGKQHFAFEVDNDQYENCKRELLSKKIAIIDEVTWKPGIKSFYFEDPEGNVLEVVPEKGFWD
jgi:catechol 2,3-dioxygenase-like lactoylglutathione lyase family enzyme